MHFQDKIVFISGTNSGIGKALVADLLHRNVQKIYVAARDTTIPSLNDPRVVTITLDITDDNQIKNAASIAHDTNVPINNAVSLNFVNALTGPLGDIRHDMEVSYFGILNMMRHFPPVLQKKE